MTNKTTGKAKKPLMKDTVSSPQSAKALYADMVKYGSDNVHPDIVRWVEKTVGKKLPAKQKK